MTAKSQAGKALAACREYDRLMTAIGDEKKIIADAECNRVFTAEDGCDYIPDGKTTHLQEVFAGYDDEDDFGDLERGYYTPDEAIEIIGDCEGCLQAYQAIQRRKAAKKALGAVKRSIRMIARVEASK